MKTLLFLFVLFAGAGFCEDPTDENLVRNSDFFFWEEGKPQDWSSFERGVIISQITNAAADGIDTALKVETREAVEGNLPGAVNQTIKIEFNSRYRLEGMVRSSKNGLCQLIVKSVSASGSFKPRFSKTSHSEWEKVSIDFESGDSNKIQILCAFKQSANFVGATGFFTKLRLKRIVE